MVNPILNPKNSLPLIKAYLFDPGRIKRLTPKQMKKYQDKAFRKYVKYAYTVPLYHDKWKEAGIHPDDVKGINDIKKLPMITKNDFRQNYPDGLLPPGYNRDKAFVICTGGTTGKSVSIFTDFYTMGKGAMAFFREIREHNLSWRKNRFVHIGNFNECRIDLVSQQNFQKPLKSVFPMKNFLNMDVNTPTKELIETLDKFKPDYMITYPAVYQHLAYLKRKGQGKNINPRVLFSAGAMLDNYTRKYVQDVFGCPLLNTYQSVEGQGIIASECIHGNWHINNDLFYLEAIDENGELVEEGKRGHLVITRLWGRGTPIIRYTGMDDWIRIKGYKKCKCGLYTPVIEGGVEGRKRANIVLPSGKVFPPGAFCFVEPVLAKNKTYKVKQYQIVQKAIDDIDIYLVIDDDMRNEGISVEEIKKQILEIYHAKAGPGVKINIKEVKEIKHPKDANKPAPIVISHVSQKQGYKIFEK